MFKMRHLMVALLAAAAFGAQAAPITRAGFAANATNFDFTGIADDVSTVGNGDLSVSNGIVRPLSTNVIAAPAYYDGGDASVLTLTWSNGVSAVGLDAMSNNAAVTLFLYDSADTLLESLTLQPSALGSICSGYPCGFIGINYGQNQIFKAVVDTPLNGNELYIDNIIYQRSGELPEPASLTLAGLSLLALAATRRRR